MNLLLSKLYAAPDSGSGGGSAPTEESTEETFELLNAEDEPEVLELPKGDKKEAEDEEGEDTGAGEEEEGDELEEIEKELEAPKEEDLNELVTPVRRKEILAKYPKLFKDFPYLEKAYYREQQFTEVYPTIQDARISAEKAQILDRTEREIMNGDISSVLAAAKQENPEVFNRIADNYLPTLKRVDQQAYYHVLGGVIKDTIITMVKEGRNLGEQGAPLQAAANILNQFVFGSQQFSPHQPLARQPRPDEQYRQEAIQQQERQIAFQKFDGVREELQTKADNVLKSTIDGHIDPRGSMSDYVKQHATTEAFNYLEDLIAKDTRFRSLLDKLWEKSYQQGFDKESTDRIKAAYLSKAKTLLPSVIKRARNNALRGRSNGASEELEMTPKKGPITPGRSTAPSSGKIRKPSDIPRGMSTLDVLMKD
jgi:hypothetical protein